jgi:glycerophosphoryl diester phosphodiesterase
VSHFRAWPWPRVLAHRGAGTLAPENTLAALRIGLAHGFRAVEFDAMVPRDDEPVLMHDAVLGRTVAGRGGVAALSAAQLAALDAGAWHSAAFAGERVPLLTAALQFCRDHALWPDVEIKPAPGHEARTGTLVARCVAAAFAGAAVTQQPLLSSFAEAALAAARAAAPQLPRAVLIDRVPDDWAARLQRHDALSLNCNHRHLTRETARAVKGAGYWLFCYTVNEPTRARQLLDWGVDAFCTDRIDVIGAGFA